MARLFLDCDGVHADFDAGARRLLGMSPAEFDRRFSKREFWSGWRATPISTRLCPK